MTTQSTARTQDDTPPAGPGRVLYQAREQRRMSTDEAARALNLSPRHIEALEADDYESLPGPTYIRGYLRGYGQLLGLDPDGLIRTYNASHVVQAPTPDLGALTPPPQISSNDRLVKLGTVVVAGLVFGLAVIWWIGREEPRTASETPVATVAPLIPAEGLPMLGDMPLGGEQGEASAPAEEAAARGTDVVPAKPVVADSVAVAPPPVATIPRPDPSVVQRASRPEPIPAPLAATVPRTKLVIRTSQESWVDVRDARQVKLLYETLAAGRSVAVEGVAPIGVFIGNAEGVTIELNGQPYDVTQHRRGQVARFILPATPPAGALLGP